MAEDRTVFWRTKIGGNIVRDGKVRGALAADGWRVLDVWECALKGRERQPVEDVLQQCVAFLESDNWAASIGVPQTVAISDEAKSNHVAAGRSLTLMRHCERTLGFPSA